MAGIIEGGSGSVTTYDVVIGDVTLNDIVDIDDIATLKMAVRPFNAYTEITSAITLNEQQIAAASIKPDGANIDNYSRLQLQRYGYCNWECDPWKE